MNAVGRVREAFTSGRDMREPYNDCEKSYLDALNDVQAELDKEVANDWEAEINQLNDKHRCEIAELKEEYECLRKKYGNAIVELEQELITSRAKLEMVELIFGGK